MLEHETVDKPRTRGDLVQLRALCDAADMEAFSPVSLSQLSDQRTPAFIVQLGSIVQAAVDLAVTEEVLNIDGLRPKASWDRIGRYAKIPGEQAEGTGLWVGVHFSLWKKHGTTPLWALFHDSDWGRAREVRTIIEPWAEKNDFLTATGNNFFAIALNIPVGEEKAGVVRSLVDEIKSIVAGLRELW